MSAQRSFLFLQGMATQFFGKLGSALEKRGHQVHRINFNGGDWLFWPKKNAVNFTLPRTAWPEFLEARLGEWAVTDIILFGDCRPLHRDAVRIASLRGVRVHVVDEGYIRPNWVTVEQGGVNGYSHLPRDPDWYHKAVVETPPWDGGKEIKSSFTRRAVEDVAYNFASVLMGWYFWGYRTHRPWHPFVEYAGWLRRFVSTRALKQKSIDANEAVLAGDKQFFLFPLQLDCDSQIREHSPFRRIAPAIEYVIASFGRHAPKDALLIIKEHPLDNGVYDWRERVSTAANAARVADRIVYVEGVPLEPLIERCQGVITVNSTVGFLGLAFGRPVKTLGDAVYDMPGLTCQSSLDQFWSQAERPNAETFDAFRRVAAARTQVNGGFFSKAALEFAVSGTVARLEADLQERYLPLPPRVSASQQSSQDELGAAASIAA